MKRFLLLLALLPSALSAQVVLSGKSLLLNSNTSPLPAGLTGTILQAGQADGVNTRWTLDGFGAAPIVNLRRADGTNASKTRTLLGDILGQIGGIGYQTTTGAYGTGNKAAVNFTAAENWTSTAQGANVEVTTTAPGATSSAVSHTFSSSGLTFNLTSQRILADFSSNPLNLRTLFQSTTTNGNTVLGVIPNGSSTISAQTYYASSDPTNAPYIYILASASGHAINSSESGTGVVQPLALQIDGVARLTVKTSGIINLSNTPSYANNAAAISGGLSAGDIYRNGDVLQIVH